MTMTHVWTAIVYGCVGVMFTLAAILFVIVIGRIVLDVIREVRA